MVFEALRRDTRRHEVVLLLVLTFGTGVVDAVSYLALDRVIAGNMSGNMLLLGMALAGGAHLQVVGPVVAFAAFWVGAQLCGVALRSTPDGWTRRTSALVATSGATVGLVGVGLVVVPPATSRPAALGAAAVLGACMGLQAAAARATGIPEVPTDVVTTAIVDLGLTFHRHVDRSPGWGRRMGSFVLIGAGALVGALLISVHPALALGLVAALSLGVAVAGRVRLEQGRTTAVAP
ncbi:YoaK family protein [Cellulomonas sp. P22]|uniref:YoaK family protein n=1 Tax=Cellulomonas sp. P22 TaxID=3373189 RepID=UPI00379989CE